MIRKLLVFLLLAFPLAAQVNVAHMMSGVNAQTGTSYTFVASDTTQLVTFNNSSPVAATLLPGSTPNFGAGSIFEVQNLGSGSVTITCSGCTINGSATLVIAANSGAQIFGDGANYSALLGGSGGGGGGSGTVTSVTATGDGTVLSSTPSAAVTTSGTLNLTLANAPAGMLLANVNPTAAVPAWTAVPVLGKSGGGGYSGGVSLIGSTSGIVSMTVAPAAGSYTFRLPIAIGSLGQCLQSNGGTPEQWSWGTCGLADPGSNGIVKRTALNTTAAALSNDVIGLFTACSGTQYLGADGACHAAGTGNTTSTSLTTSKIPKASGANSIIDSSITDNGTTVSTTEPFTAASVASGSGSAACGSATGCIAAVEGATGGTPTTGNDYIRADSTTHQWVQSVNGGAEGPLTATSASSLDGAETTAPTGTAGRDKMWPDSTAHRWTMNNNNGGAFMVPGIASAQIASNCVQFAANGIDLTSSGALCPPPNGVVYATAHGVKADGRIVLDASTTSGTKTITCPNNDCNFVAGDVGKIVWVQSTRTSGADVLVQDVIATVNSAQSITVTTNNASSSHTANAVLKWGTDDGAALDTAYQATGPANCSALLLPSGFILTGQPEFNYAVTGCPLSDTFQVPLIQGLGSTATVIIPTPNFNKSAGHGCSAAGVNACFFGAQYEIFFYMKIDGGGNTIATPGTINLVQNNSALSFDFVVSNWCSGCSTVTGFSTIGPESENLFGGSVAAGGNACSSAGVGEVYDNYFCSQVAGSGTGPAMSVTGSGNTLLSRGNSFQGSIIVGAGATMSSYDDYDAGTGASWQVAGTANLFSFHKVATNPPILSTASTAKINIFNSSLPSSTHATYPGLSYLGWSGSTLTDQGGNTFSGAVGPNYPGPIQSTTANVSSGTSVSKAWPVAPAPHSIQIVACFDFPSTSTINTPTDTRTLTWVQIGTNQTTGISFGSAMNTAVYYAIDAAGGADTVTCNFSAAVTTGVIDLVELDGAAISSPLDGSTTSSGSGTSVTSSAQNTTQNGDYSFLMAFRNTAATFSTGSCTPTACFANSGNAFMGSIYHYVPVAGSQAMSGTWSVNSDWTAFWFNFKAYGMPTVSGSAFALNCAAVGSAANPSVANCGSASTGAFSCATNASNTTCVVNTASVTANSEIFVQQVVDEGTRLGVTCNTGSVLPAGPLLLSKTAGVGFTLTMGTITTNPGCFNYQVVN